MADFKQTIVGQLCKIGDTLDKLRSLTEAREVRDTTGIFFMTIPENGGSRVFSTGVTKIDFISGIITNPDATTEKLQLSLQGAGQEFLHSLSLNGNVDFKIRIGDLKKYTIPSNVFGQIPYLNYNKIEIECTSDTNISIFACTNPSAVIGQFKSPLLIQSDILTDATPFPGANIAAIKAKTDSSLYTSRITPVNNITPGAITVTIQPPAGETWDVYISASCSTGADGDTAIVEIQYWDGANAYPVTRSKYKEPINSAKVASQCRMRITNTQYVRIITSGNGTLTSGYNYHGWKE